MSDRALNFRGHVVVGGELTCRTGLHIGGNRDSLVIGGHDLPVARDPATRLPIVPGSSLRGRLRSRLEMLRGRVRFDSGASETSGDADEIALLFGRAGGKSDFGPSRLLVRDGLPVESDGISSGKREKSTLDWWRMLETDGLGTEVKAETAVNRVTAAATPRHVERVLAGSRFRIEFVLSVYDFWPDEERLLKDLLTSLALVEDSYLGGHGSRGYGRVEIKLNEVPAVSTAKDYEAGRKKSVPLGELKALDDIDADAWVKSVSERLGGDAG